MGALAQHHTAFSVREPHRCGKQAADGSAEHCSVAARHGGHPVPCGGCADGLAAWRAAQLCEVCVFYMRTIRRQQRGASPAGRVSEQGRRRGREIPAHRSRQARAHGARHHYRLEDLVARSNVVPMFDAVQLIWKGRGLSLFGGFHALHTPGVCGAPGVPCPTRPDRKLVRRVVQHARAQLARTHKPFSTNPLAPLSPLGCSTPAHAASQPAASQPTRRGVGTRRGAGSGELTFWSSYYCG